MPSTKAETQNFSRHGREKLKEFRRDHHKNQDQDARRLGLTVDMAQYKALKHHTIFTQLIFEPITFQTPLPNAVAYVTSL